MASLLRDRFPDLLPLCERLYPAGSYGAVRSGDPYAVCRRVWELCRRCGVSDRMPRPIIPGDKRALNKRVVEALANECYRMELENASGQRAWAYRKAAWAIEAPWSRTWGWSTSRWGRFARGWRALRTSVRGWRRLLRR